MPLEQIRPSVQFFRSDRKATSDDVAQQYEDGMDEFAEMNEAYDEYTESPRVENMNLLKLGGVGGVTRSGSWNRNLLAREQIKSSIRSSQPDEEHLDRANSFKDASNTHQSITGSGSLHRSQSGSHPEKIRRNIVEQVRPSSSSDVPSSSSRTSTSTSSYSGAAFSLRSVSNRNSVSSTSSSGASSARSPRAASEDESTATNSSKGKSQDTNPSSSSTFTSTMNQSTLGVQLHSNEGIARSFEKDQRASPKVDCIVSAGKARAPQELTLTDQSDSIYEEEQAIRSCDWPNSSPLKRDLGQSPRTDSLPLPSKCVSPSLGTLTLSAAAASPASPVMTTEAMSTSTFVPPAPRRHTNRFALRSKSAFSQSGQPHGIFTGAGGGRAAARELARRGDSSSYENAPFSELEARRLRNPTSNPSSQSTSPNPPHHCLPLTPSSSDFQFIAATPHSANEASKRHSNQFSPRNTEVIPFSDGTLGSPRLARRRELSNSSDFSSIRGESSYHSSRKSSIRLVDVDTAKANACCSPPLLHTPNSSLFGVSPASALNRPSLAHAHSTTNVLRTPTTEEWSRFLAKQGVDPAAVAAASSGGRARTNTGRSNSSQQPRRLLSALGSSPNPASELALAATLQQQQQQSQSGEVVHTMDMMHLPNEEDEEVEEAMVSSLGRLGLHRIPIPSKGILASSDDLSMLHEDYEGEQDSEGSSSDERMRALHEAISRPPSRRGSPPPILDSPDSPTSILESEWDKMIKSPILAATVRRRRRRRSKKPSREAAAIVLGYPLAPPGERRKIDDFIIQNDIGRGAYGLVKRARLKDDITGQAIGREFVIKYIIKSRILADCWRRHKILGPIPIEIHVMDQLRRLPYKSADCLAPWSVESLLEYPAIAQEEALLQIKESVGHPSLCKMIDFFEDHEFYYMVMPCFGKGQDLFDYIEAQPHGLSSLQVRCIFGQVADGLCFLHQNNIVHRDIKDENVILDGNGHAQIIDFGSAAHVNKSGRLFDTFSGTLDYAAAEILKGEKYSGKEQDVWALGVVGYVLLCGDCPFWNGEEAIQGVVPGTRAYDVLMERCCNTILLESEEYQKRLVDQLGQKDGGGKIEDAADLIQRCLEINLVKRPSMEAICQHRFLVGQQGWIGAMGWMKEESIVSS